MGKITAEVVAIVMAVAMVLFGLSAGFAGLIVESEEKNQAQDLASKAGLTITKVNFQDGTSALAYKTHSGQYIDLHSMLNAYNGYTDKVIIYNIDGDMVIGESNAPISFNNAAGLIYSAPGYLIRSLSPGS